MKAYVMQKQPPGGTPLTMCYNPTACDFIKKTLKRGYFLVNFTKYFKNTLLAETFEGLILVRHL